MLPNVGHKKASMCLYLVYRDADIYCVHNELIMGSHCLADLPRLAATPPNAAPASVAPLHCCYFRCQAKNSKGKEVCYFADLPGYGYAKMAKDTQRTIEVGAKPFLSCFKSTTTHGVTGTSACGGGKMTSSVLRSDVDWPPPCLAATKQWSQTIAQP